jgi:hypothetical protein
MRYSNETKSALIAIVWGVIAVIVGIYFWSSSRSTRTTRDVQPITVNAPSVTQVSNGITSRQKILITLNDLVISSEPSMDIISENVLSLSSLVAKAGMVVLMYTIPEELVGESPDPPECVSDVVDSLVVKGALVEQGFKPHRIIYTATREGRVSVAREIQADVTIESDESIASELGVKGLKIHRLTAENFREFIRSF